ncbi:SDR family oxidoreductase [Protofrankia symbiont of Coriaria ruscifolia]|uniref:NmrA family protein n=1 Tax=Candidatus Protofrankia californiensis TaxID=1839754 RepID=A0A1C3NTR8_9ACTN|nr:NAD(P)H-binding protein [Protofrankia symbiont of Coriaria ruscifolia]SBW18133.1 NmrA family protein [Candidatus Protofrankia californiensis]
MILVTGATGNVGRQVTSQLLNAGVPVRALTRDPDSARLPHGVDIVRGDLLTPDTVATAIHGAEAVFLMWPFPTAKSAPSVLDALKEHARRIVFLSSGVVRDDLDKQANSIGRRHADVERSIERSGMEWTFLRPHGFATNTFSWAPQIRAGDIVRGAYGAAAMTLLHELDIASVAVHALIENDHVGRRYVLTGPEILTQVEQVHILGDAIGRPLLWEEIPPDAARQQMLSWLPSSVVDVVLDGYAHMVTEPGPMTSTVEEITGVPARTFREWATDHVDDFD